MHRWFREYGTVQNFGSKDLRYTYSGRTVNARTQRNIDSIRDRSARSNLPLTPWRPFGAYLGKNMTFMQRDFNN